MRILQPTTTFVILAVFCVVGILLSWRWDLALIIGFTVALVGAYFSLLVRARELLTHWGLEVSLWSWVLFFPVLCFLLGTLNVVFAVFLGLSETLDWPLYVPLSIGMILMSLLLSVVAGMIAVGLDLIGMVPRHQRKSALLDRD